MERRADLDKRSGTRATGRTTSEMSLALWLRTGRAQKSLSLDDVARITKIQPRILEQLEAGKLDGLPAEVFVRGFVRSFAKCVGLDEDEALKRLAACKPGTAKAAAVIDAMGDLAPNARSKHPHMLADAPEPLEVSPAASIEESIAADVEIEIATAIEPAMLIEPTSDQAVEAVEAVEAIEPVEAIMVTEASVVNAVPEVVVPVEAPPVVVAPPRNIDLTADSVPVVVDAAPKKKRAPRKRKAAAGTPSEPLPIVKEELDVAGTTSEPIPTTKRRARKPRGSVPPPVETIAPVEASTANIAVEASSANIAAEVSTANIAADSSSVKLAADASSTNIVGDSSSVVDASSTNIIGDSSAAPSVTLADANASSDELVEHDFTAAEAFAALGRTEPVVESTDSTVSSDSVIDTESAATTFDVWQAELDTATTRFERTDGDDEVPIDMDGTWTPKMPPLSTTMTPPWRRPAHAAMQPSLVAVIDDADPEAAERVLEDRRTKEPRTRTFLPPILLDREGDRSARQGGLTLAVIILLIAATLTLSYLMRRPSATGDGVTQIELVSSPHSLA